MISGRIGVNRTEDGEFVAANCCASASLKQDGIIASATPYRIILQIQRSLRRTDC
ncbi:hypothetical protein IMCC20628_01545 [Hoeflea sp. IMCC20628]|uniref:hypothetical protein n=1 Tax=Hoeflea sp. IMCC20628 TaxID=1620421 RepID=UPI00063BE8E9|nr:hypothetical protein [Hoeflea sp. IMCC20628]AKI00261.1 hypothetical protein IMCC20628_01545 [Hoeflea sp. IMCC20628]